MLPQRDFAVALCLFGSFFGYYGEAEDEKSLASVRTKTHLILEEATFSWETSRYFSRWLFFSPEGA
jgi:hypothetical protein